MFYIGRRDWFFGFDPSDNVSYILIIWEDFEDEGFVRMLKYDSKGLIWEAVASPEFDCNIFYSDSVCSNGYIYWISRVNGNPDNIGGFFVRYCPRTMDFSRFDLPFVADVTKHKLVDFGGSVGILSTVGFDNNSYNSTFWLFESDPESLPHWKNAISFNGISYNLRILGLF